MDKILLKRIKTLLFIFLICASLACLFSCGGDDDDDEIYDENDYVNVTIYQNESDVLRYDGVYRYAGSNLWSSSRTGYKFLGLFDQAIGGVMLANSDGVLLYDLNDGAVLYAQWEKLKFQTTFVIEEHGTIDDSANFYVEIGDRIETLPLPELDEGYEFIGWAFADGTLISNGERVIDGYQDANEENSFWLSDGAFKAVIQQKKVKLTLDYNLDTDNYTEDFEMVYGEGIDELEPLDDDEENYVEFVGWSLSPISYMPYTEDASLERLTEDVTLYAYWQRYKPVSFVYEGYEDVYRVYENQSFTMPVPDIPGKKLDAWFASPVFNTLPISSINYYSAMDTYYAKMSIATYSIKFQTSGSEALTELSYQMGQEFSLPVLQREHFTFDGWCLKEDLSDTPITEISFDMYGDLVLYPKFTGESVSVNLNSGAGYLAQSSTDVEYYAKNTLPIPTLDGYAFLGWYFDEALTDRLTNENGESLEVWDTLESGLTLYAKYAKKYYVTISDAPNGSFTSNLKPYYVEGEFVSLEITPSSDYAFGGIYREGKLVSKTPTYSFYMTAKNVEFTLKLTRVGRITVTRSGMGSSYVKSISVPETAKEGDKISISFEIQDYYKEIYGINKIIVNGVEVRLDKSLSFTMPSGDANVEIIFDYKRYLEIDTGDTGIVIYERNGHYYAFINKKMNWEAAQAYCETFGGHLVTLTSDGESEFVSSIRTMNLAFTTNVWIGATDKGSEGNWKWVTGEKFSSFVNWSSGEPSNSSGNEHYAHLSSGTKSWNDNDVGESFYFICEWDNKNEIKFPSVKKVVDINGEELWLTLHENNGHYYSIFQTPMSWKAAEKYCEYLGGYLVCIETESENEYVRNLRELIGSYSDNVWIGATDEAAEGVWRWINGQAVNFTSWASSQPDNASKAEHFAHLYATSKALTWNDAPGEKEYLFICEWDKKTDVGKIRYGNFFNVIETREQFISVLQNRSVTDGHIYELCANIDLSGYIWTPNDFAGTIIGNGYTVSNLTVEASEGNLGMFLKLSGSISDLKFKNLIVNSTSLSAPLVGGICAELTGSIKNVEIQSGLISAKGSTGGIAGKMTGGEIIGCINRARVSSSVNNGVGAGTGGIVGVATAGIVDNCQNYGKIEGGSYTGGIVGTTADNSSLVISRLKNSGEITSSADYAGGIAGLYSRRGSYEITAFENTGNVSAASYAGGIFGRFNDSSDAKDDNTYSLLIENLKNSANITATNDYAGGIFGYLYAEYYRSGYSGSVVLTALGIQNTGDVFGRYYVGGIAGKIFTDSSESALSQSASSASVSATAYIGGLIGRADNLCIKNSSNAGSTLTASGSYVDGSSNYAYFGGYVGYAAKSDIIGVKNEVNIDYSALSCIGSHVGGIAGYSTGTFTDCTNNAQIYAPSAAYVGGIAGDCQKAYTYSMSNLRNTGAVRGKTYVGGVFGRLYSYITEKNSNTYNVEFSTVKNTAEVFAAEDYAGGLFGYFYLGHWYSSSYDGKYIVFINGSENTGKVTGRYFVGGIMGYGLTDATESTIGSAKNSSDIVADAYAGCIAGHLDRLNLVSPSNAGSTLTLKGTYVSSNAKYAYVGGYVGNAINLTVSDAENGVTVDYSSPLCQGQNVGGIAGASTGVFVRCKNNASINAPLSENVGGICGNLTKTGTYALSDLENTGTVTGKSALGGIFGKIYAVDSGKHSNTYTVNISSLKNTASVGASGDYAGGIFGYFYFSNWYSSSYNGKVIVFITEAVNEANITGQNYVGGLIGYGYTDASDSTMSSSSSSGAITANAYAGGIAGKLEELNIISTSNEGTLISVSGTLDVSGTNYACVGGYVGSYQGSTITGAVNYANIDYSSALATGLEVGGIVGASTSILIDCENNGRIYAPYASYVGGIAGSLYITGSYDVSGLTNTGDVTGKALVGGIFGYVKNQTSDKSTPTYVMNFTKLKNDADVIASGEAAGGLIGKVIAEHYYSGSYNGTVSLYISESNCAGSVYAAKYSGGYIGYADTDSALSTIFSSTITAKATGEESVGEYFGYSDNFTVSS